MDDGAKSRSRFLLPAAILIPLLAAGGFLLWQAARAKVYRRADYLMGTLVEITAYGGKARAGVDAAFAAMRRIEALTDSRRPGSDVARLARAAGRGPVRVRPETMAMLRLAAAYWRRSRGAFDVTVAPVVRAWGFEPGGKPRLPRRDELLAALRLVGGGDLILDARAGTARLARAGMAVDLGGLAKGYAVDRAYEALARAGVRGALINGGGSSIRVLGRPPRGGRWRIGLAHPRRAGEFLAVFLLRPGEALGTSADNQRFFMAGGRRYAHLIDPATGEPARRSILFSVVGGRAAVADILSTACFVLGPKEGLEFAARERARGLVYGADGRVRRSPGLSVSELNP